MEGKPRWAAVPRVLLARLDPSNLGSQQGVPKAVMARNGAYLYGSGATLVFSTLLIPHGRVNSAVGVAAVTIVAMSAAICLYLWGEHFPRWIFALISPFGSVMIGGVMFWGGSYAFAYALLYVWAALYAFSFFTLASSLTQFLAILMVAGMYLFVVSPGSDSSGYWLMTAGTGVVAGFFIQRLIRKVESNASVDPVTGAFNRRTWDQELPKALARASRGGRDVSLLLADLDHFKIFNDEHGHQAGDRLLSDVVTHWQGLLRGGDMLARYGGEEFALVLEGCDVDEAVRVADKLRAAVPAGRTCSFGAAQWDREEGARALVARADAALYEAKRLGRDRAVAAPTNRVAQPEGVLGETARWAQSLYTILSHRAESEELPMTAAYQPIVRLDNRELIGLEALGRPAGAAAGMSVEGLFYTAQRLGRTRDIDWLCRRVGLDRARNVRPGFQVFLNTSMAALLDPLHDVDQMLLLLKWVGRDPQDVVLELTERETVLDPARMANVLAQYRAEGFRFAVDDLGEGRSGMEVVAAAMPEYIKVARRLVHDDTLGSQAMIEAAVAFARRTGAAVIAEGIETIDELERMRSVGIELGQGYLLGRPAFDLPDAAVAADVLQLPLRVLPVRTSA